MATTTKIHYRGAVVPGANTTETTANVPLTNPEIDGNFYSLAASIDTKVGTADVIAVAKGGTGATDAATARGNLGLGTASTQATGYFQVAGSYEAPLTFSNGVSRTTNAITVTYGSSVNTVCQGNDSRLSDARAASGGTAANISGTLAIANGGTNITGYTTGDILYSSATNVLSKLAIGTVDGYFLKISGGLPVWGADNNTLYDHLAVSATGGAILRLHGTDGNTDDVKFVSDGGTTVSYVDDNSIKISSVLANDAALTVTSVAAATGSAATLALSGAYSSNAATARSLDFRVGPALTNLANLMTTAGAGFIRRGATADTYSIDTNTYLTSVGPPDFASQAANTVLAAPNGSAGTPTFRLLVAADIPNHDAAKITSGVIDAARLPSYVDDVLEYANVAAFPGTGETGKMYVALDTNKVYRWSGSAYIYITSGAVDSVAGQTGIVILSKGDVGLGNVNNSADATKSVLYAATAGGVTNGVYTTGSYANPAWITSLAASKVGLGSVDNTADSAKSVSYAATAGSAPASDVYAWAKAATKPSYTASDVGLGSVNNTADSAKSVSYAATAGSAGSAAANDVYAWAKAATKPSYTYSEVGAQVAGSYQAAGSYEAPLTFSLAGLSRSVNAISISYGVAAGTVCQGNDVRLGDARIAADVYYWAKQSTKPSYAFNEITSAAISCTTITATSITASGDITAFYTSDKKFKENIQTIPNALDKVDAIGGKTFDWTDEYIETRGGVDGYFVVKSDFGVIAQDVQEAFPIATRTKPDGTLAVDYEKLVAVAFAAIKELRAEIEELKKGR